MDPSSGRAEARTLCSCYCGAQRLRVIAPWVLDSLPGRWWRCRCWMHLGTWSCSAESVLSCTPLSAKAECTGAWSSVLELYDLPSTYMSLVDGLRTERRLSPASAAVACDLRRMCNCVQQPAGPVASGPGSWLWLSRLRLVSLVD